MKVPFVNPNPGPEGQYPVNMYYNPETESGREAMIGTPGLTEWCAFPVQSDANLILDGDLEIWTDAVTPKYFYALVSNLTTINRETSIKATGTYSCRMDIDSENTPAYLETDYINGINAGAEYRLSFSHRESTADATVKFSFYIQDRDGALQLSTIYYLKADGSFQATTPVEITLPNSHNQWSIYENSFFAPGSYPAYFTLSISSDDAADASIYIDNIRLEPVGHQYNLVTDGGFESFDPAGRHDYWNFVETGASTITKTIYNEVLMSIDAGNNEVDLYQYFVSGECYVLPDRKYKYRFTHRETGTATVAYSIACPVAGFLQADGSFDAVIYWFPVSHSDSDCAETQIFTIPTGLLNPQSFLNIRSDAAASSEIYISDVRLDSDFGTVRGMLSYNNTLYVVAGEGFYRVSPDGTYEAVSGSLNTAQSDIFEMKCNGTQIMIIDGRYGYVYTIATDVLALISDADFPVPTSLAQHGLYFIVTALGTNRVYLSQNGTSWDALDYDEAEAFPDWAVQCFVDHDELLVFGNESVEVWYSTPTASFPFGKRLGATIPTGIEAIRSLVRQDNSVFFLTVDRQFARLNGYNLEVVTPPELDRLLASYDHVSDAIAFAYTMNGMPFIILTIPDAGKTWEYNCRTQKWHDRRSWQLGSDNPGRYRGVCYAFFNNLHLIGDHTNGKIYTLSSGVYQEDGHDILRERITIDITAEGQRMFFAKLRMNFKPAAGTATLDWSDDGGTTWFSDSATSPTATMAEKTDFFRLGSATRRRLKLSVTDNVDFRLYEATI